MAHTDGKSTVPTWRRGVQRVRASVRGLRRFVAQHGIGRGGARSCSVAAAACDPLVGPWIPPSSQRAAARATQEARAERLGDGTTVVCALLRGTSLTVANVGGEPGATRSASPPNTCALQQAPDARAHGLGMHACACYQIPERCSGGGPSRGRWSWTGRARVE
eukprot:3359488-Prymnesium_polylepis.1